MTITIRVAGVDDREAVAGLNAEVQALHWANRGDEFKPARPDVLAAWVGEQLAKGAVRVWVAERARTVVGYVLVQPRSADENAFCLARSWWEIDQLGVAAGQRRGGVARALLQRVMSEARAEGVRHLELQTWAFNHDAQVAFQRLGFVPKRIRYELPIDAASATQGEGTERGPSDAP